MREKRRIHELSAVGSRGGHTLQNVARYQLRHTPIGGNVRFFCQIRKWSNLWSKVFAEEHGGGKARKREKNGDFASFRRSAHEAVTRSQTTRATNCATSRFCFPIGSAGRAFCFSFRAKPCLEESTARCADVRSDAAFADDPC